ncbi:DUF397 domain-containing protein [Streptomyces beihaiensis]|uniref:DUF397 domain-containing protein n=1 Tax=Streptomyces beihaiensis TaxID=2984495 RepID=A0ABT3TP31_9ACTN|nr:DUF397 domain-containing protein [Streptomyces beihaiensis]MCX3058515.1 DUF397 domain-containing protein [Streptomyces beihaiensis]
MTEHTILDSSALNGWRKSSYSGNEGGSCVEVVDAHPSGVPVRDSKNPHGPALVMSADSWASFVSALSDGDLPA